MKRVLFCVVLSVLATAPAMFADVVDYMLNVNGTTYCPSYTGATCTNNGGLAAAGASSSLDLSFGGTGLGSVSLTYNPGIGSYNADLWLFEELFPPTGYNEYGATGGSPAAGQSWQIDTPDYDYVDGFDPDYGGLAAGAGSIIANTTAGTLADTNYVPGNLDQFSFGCSGSPNCNDYTSMAMGFNFTLGAGQEEVLTFNVSQTAPANGFFLEQIAPVDGANPTEMDYYYTATATTQPISTVVPEPNFRIPLAVLMGSLLGLAIRRRLAAV